MRGVVFGVGRVLEGRKRGERVKGNVVEMTFGSF